MHISNEEETKRKTILCNFTKTTKRLPHTLTHISKGKWKDGGFFIAMTVGQRQRGAGQEMQSKCPCNATVATNEIVGQSAAFKKAIATHTHTYTYMHKHTHVHTSHTRIYTFTYTYIPTHNASFPYGQCIPCLALQWNCHCPDFYYCCLCAL